jgi:uncharacterized protein with FMN-binding domain
MAKKMPGRLVALSASAIATIYLAGRVSTQWAADNVASASAGADTPAAVSPSATATSTNVATSTPTVVVGASATSTPSPTATSTSTSASPYANGTYTGTGTSRFGNVSVSVTIAGGNISNVQITKVTTSYPVSRIASLPAQVVQKQTASVNSISGATYSSQAFKLAVQQALTQAQAALSAAS